MNYEPELNFAIEFNLSRNGMIEEIRTEFDVLRICFTQLDELEAKYAPCIDRIMVMPLRKLLCEKNSVLLRVCPDFKMLPLHGPWIELDGKLKLIRPPLAFTKQDAWIPLSDWLETKVAYFNRDVKDLPIHIPEYLFELILNKLNKSEKTTFQDLFELREVELHGQKESSYFRKNEEDEAKNQTIYALLKKVNYYDLSIYNFIKHLSDKRGAHIDVGHGPVIELVNQKDNNGHNLILLFAIQLIWAVKNQIPELSDYWPEMDTTIMPIIK